jgi:antirestriction protein ArdC
LSLATPATRGYAGAGRRSFLSAVQSFLSRCAGEKQKRPTGQTGAKRMQFKGRNQRQPQRQTAKEVIAANVQHLIQQLEQGHSETLTAYLTAMSRFHSYSFGNILEIARQMPEATHVAGLYTWNQLGRKVKKGEKGIRILAPIIGAKRKPQEELDKDITKHNRPVLVGFRAAYVFDISQTEGAELPEHATVKGDAGANRDRLIEFVHAQGIELEFHERIAPAMGMSYGGKIVLLPGQAKAEEFSTLVHELAHEMLHKADRRTTSTKVVRETEAEAVAFVVGKAVGLEMETASADYIHLYHGNAVLLAESLEVIQKASAVILAALEPKPQFEEQETQDEMGSRQLVRILWADGRTTVRSLIHTLTWRRSALCLSIPQPPNTANQ